ncbi:hypothetical protein ACFLYU_00135 [Candidatus Dependentiae bacterium]
MQKFICTKILVALTINLLVVPFANCMRNDSRCKRKHERESYRKNKFSLKGNKFKKRLKKQEIKQKNKKNQVERLYGRGSQRLAMISPFNKKSLVSFLVVAFLARTAFSATGCDGKYYDYCGPKLFGMQRCEICQEYDIDWAGDQYCTTLEVLRLDCRNGGENLVFSSCSQVKKTLLDSGIQLEGQTFCFTKNVTDSAGVILPQTDCCHFMKNKDTSACERSAGYSLANMGISPVLSFLAPVVAFFLYKYFPKMCKKKNKNNNAITYEEEKKLTQEQRRELREGKKLERKSRPELETQSKRALRQAPVFVKTLVYPEFSEGTGRQDETTESETESETETGTD